MRGVQDYYSETICVDKVELTKIDIINKVIKFWELSNHKKIPTISYINSIFSNSDGTFGYDFALIILGQLIAIDNVEVIKVIE